MQALIKSWRERFGRVMGSRGGSSRRGSSLKLRELRLEPLEERQLLSAGPPEIGRYYPSGGASQFILDSNGNRSWDASDAAYYYGNAADTPITAIGTTTESTKSAYSAHRPATASSFWTPTAAAPGIRVTPFTTTANLPIRRSPATGTTTERTRSAFSAHPPAAASSSWTPMATVS
jgi:hypothetical protein